MTASIQPLIDCKGPLDEATIIKLTDYMFLPGADSDQRAAMKPSSDTAYLCSQPY